MTASNGRTIGKVVALVIPVGVFLSLAACVIDDGPTGLQIVQDQWIETGTGAAACSVPVTATTEQRTEGVLDVALPDPSQTHYLFYPLVENLLAPFTGLVSGSGGPVEEKNNIVMKSFHVKLDVTFTAGTNFPWDSGCSGEFDVQVATSQLAPGGTRVGDCGDHQALQRGPALPVPPGRVQRWPGLPRG